MGVRVPVLIWTYADSSAAPPLFSETVANIGAEVLGMRKAKC